MNELRRQGLEVHRATSAFKAGSVSVEAGDYVIRGDQPYRTLADMYFAVQNYAPANPNPYDDTGWTFPYMRNIVIKTVTDKGVLDGASTLLTADAKAPGGIEGTGPVVIVDHTTDNVLMAFRFKHAGVKMQAAEEDFEAGGRKFRAGAFIIPAADRAALDPTMKALGIAGFSVASAPTVATHDLDVPRIGYVHAWSNTQNEGWVRAALDTYGVPYTYFGDIKLREGNLRQKYDVIIFPHVGGNAQSQVNGIPKTGSMPLPVQEDGGDAESRRSGSGRRHSRRHGMGRADGARQVRARGRHAHHRGLDVDDLSGLQHHVGRDGRESRQSVRARLGDAWRGLRPSQSDCVRLRRAGAGVLQSDSGAERRRRRIRRFRRRRARR